MPVTILSSDGNYLDYARSKHGVIQGLYHFRLPLFFRELLSETPKLMSTDDISAQLTIFHAKKVKDEKGPTKKSNYPALKSDLKKGKL